MRTTTLKYEVRVTYESDEPLSPDDIEVLRQEVESTLHNANTCGELDPDDRAIQAYALEVAAPSQPQPQPRRSPRTDREALLGILMNLHTAGWKLEAVNDGDGWERISHITPAVDAVEDVDGLVTLRLRHHISGVPVALCLLAQGSPEDLVVDHTADEQFTEDLDKARELLGL